MTTVMTETRTPALWADDNSSRVALDVPGNRCYRDDDDDDGGRGLSSSPFFVDDDAPQNKIAALRHVLVPLPARDTRLVIIGRSFCVFPISDYTFFGGDNTRVACGEPETEFREWKWALLRISPSSSSSSPKVTTAGVDDDALCLVNEGRRRISSGRARRACTHQLQRVSSRPPARSAQVGMFVSVSL